MLSVYMSILCCDIWNSPWVHYLMHVLENMCQLEHACYRYQSICVEIFFKTWKHTYVTTRTLVLLKLAYEYKCFQIKIPILFSPPLSLSKDTGSKRKMKWLDYHGEPSVDGGWGIGGDDFDGEGNGTDIWSSNIVASDAGTSGWGCTIVVGGGRGGWGVGAYCCRTDEGNLCCISRFML